VAGSFEFGTGVPKQSLNAVQQTQCSGFRMICPLDLSAPIGPGMNNNNNNILFLAHDFQTGMVYCLTYTYKDTVSFCHFLCEFFHSNIPHSRIVFFLFFLYSSFHSLGVASRWLRLNCLTSLQTYATPMRRGCVCDLSLFLLLSQSCVEYGRFTLRAECHSRHNAILSLPHRFFFSYFTFLPIYLSLFLFGSQGK